MKQKKPIRKRIWTLWKDTMAVLATGVLVLYSMNAFLHTFDAATMNELVLKYQILAIVVFWCSFGIATLFNWVYSWRHE
jgi:hypothetical protein